jgi:hypothetical protein
MFIWWRGGFEFAFGHRFRGESLISRTTHKFLFVLKMSHNTFHNYGSHAFYLMTHFLSHGLGRVGCNQS